MIPIELRSVRRIDIALAAVGLPLMALGLGTGFYLLMHGSPAAATLSAPALAMGVGMGSLGLGGLWRAFDRRPLMSADASGVRFHPAHVDGLIPWTEIGPVRVEGSKPAYLVFALHRRIWAVEAPLTARRVRLGLNYAGLGRRRARKLIMEFSRLRAANVPAYRDPDADD